MSAWIVDKAVIDLLVEAFFRYEIVTVKPQTPDSLGTLLWKENHKSVNYRYHEKLRAPRYAHESARMVYQDHPITARGTVKDLARDGLFVLQQVQCYGYQTCEHPTWRRSKAYAYTQALEAAILKSLGMTEEKALDVLYNDSKTRLQDWLQRYPWVIMYND